MTRAVASTDDAQQMVSDARIGIEPKGTRCAPGSWSESRLIPQARFVEYGCVAQGAVESCRST